MEDHSNSALHLAEGTPSPQLCWSLYPMSELELEKPQLAVELVQHLWHYNCSGGSVLALTAETRASKGIREKMAALSPQWHRLKWVRAKPMRAADVVCKGNALGLCCRDWSRR